MAGPGMQLFGAEELTEVDSVLTSRDLCRYPFVSRQWGDPSKVDLFEKAVEEWTGVAHCIATNSCTSALLTGLWAAGIEPGDEIIVPGFSFVAPIAAVAYSGATPVLAEIDETLTLDADDVRRKISERTRAILAVHALGSPCDLARLSALARSHGLALFEDAAQAVGGSCLESKLGSVGTFGTYSLNPFKTITSGEGGVLLTNDTSLYLRAYAIHDHGEPPRRRRSAGASVASAALLGLNFRMHGLAGAIALAQFRKLPDILRVLRLKKRRLADAIGPLPCCVERPVHDPSGECATVLAYIFDSAAMAEAVADELGTDVAINTGKHYYGNIPELTMGPRAVAAKAASNAFCYPRGCLPRTDDILARTIVLSVGLVDESIGASRGINIGSTDEEIAAFAAEFAGAVNGVLARHRRARLATHTA